MEQRADDLSDLWAATRASGDHVRGRLRTHAREAKVYRTDAAPSTARSPTRPGGIGRGRPAGRPKGRRR